MEVCCALCCIIAFADNNCRALRAVEGPVAQIPGRLDEGPQRAARGPWSGGGERGLVGYEHTRPGRGGAGGRRCPADEAVMAAEVSIRTLLKPRTHKLRLMNRRCRMIPALKLRLPRLLVDYIDLFTVEFWLCYRDFQYIHTHVHIIQMSLEGSE